MTTVLQLPEKKIRINVRNYNCFFCYTLSIFILWSLIQVLVPVQIFSVKLIQSLNSLKVTAPAVGIILGGLFFWGKYRVYNDSIPFLVFSGYSLINVIMHVILDGGNFNSLFQPIMFMIWTFCMFIYVPVALNTFPKILTFLRLNTILIFVAVLFFSLKTIITGYHIGEVAYGGGRGGSIRYSLLYLNAGYLGGICYSVICGAMMIFEMSTNRLEKICSLMSV